MQLLCSTLRRRRRTTSTKSSLAQDKSPDTRRSEAASRQRKASPGVSKTSSTRPSRRDASAPCAARSCSWSSESGLRKPSHWCERKSMDSRSAPSHSRATPDATAASWLGSSSRPRNVSRGMTKTGHAQPRREKKPSRWLEPSPSEESESSASASEKPTSAMVLGRPSWDSKVDEFSVVCRLMSSVRLTREPPAQRGDVQPDASEPGVAGGVPGSVR
mmetsp:Transcript_27799/g.83325  ORF Transcript_27799/g.83325 Transcript_27799/m.83325 type:complete len:217 (+) Transcript_27799:585-1235(+)